MADLLWEENKFQGIDFYNFNKKYRWGTNNILTNVGNNIRTRSQVRSTPEYIYTSVTEQFNTLICTFQNLHVREGINENMYMTCYV